MQPRRAGLMLPMALALVFHRTGPQFEGSAGVCWFGGLRGPIQFVPPAYTGADVRFAAICIRDSRQ
jgi:hypothetical protein